MNFFWRMKSRLFVGEAFKTSLMGKHSVKQKNYLMIRDHCIQKDHYIQFFFVTGYHFIVGVIYKYMKKVRHEWISNI